ncbi:MAG: M48 family metallopeptidase [Bacteroidales bacterium]|jgi:STE24 endopeptidase|nr:M48 family metallopeptidase [Bacteroidales bacterium]MDG2080348.1 M48 family metallopeptidase [Bacteroidales bacterium]|tara:strand:- start:5897 stop:7135 length:1239 start_codon:yes stop_codon:yes gene_type:complete
MNVEAIFWVIIIIIIFDYLLDQLLDYLNYKTMQEKVPSQLKGIYDDDKYEESQRYGKENMIFSFFTSTFSFILILLLLFGSGFAFLDDYVRSITPNDYLRTILFFGIFGLAMDIISIPFQLYGTFVIEGRFGFNKTTPLTFVKDKVKSWLLSAIIAGGLILFVMWAWKETGPWFWIIVMGGMSIFMVFMTMFYSRIIVPIFNKQTPLEDGSLKVSINEFATKAQFKIDNIFVIDGSKRSTKANAYFTGLGSKKRIVLYDTLINDLSNEEIVAVLAHEVGHNKLKHVITGLIISMLQSGLMLALLYFALGSPDLSLAMGATDASFYMGVLAFGLLFSPISRILGIFSNIISRRNEYQADRFASKYGLAKNLVSGLIKLSVANLSNLTPHWLYVAINYSHPTLLQRKKALEALK